MMRRSQGNINFAGYEYTFDTNSDTFKEFQKNTFYSALLYPFYPYDYPTKKGKSDKVINAVMYDSLKKSIEFMKFVQQTLPHIDKAIELAEKTA